MSRGKIGRSLLSKKIGIRISALIAFGILLGSSQVVEAAFPTATCSLSGNNPGTCVFAAPGTASAGTTIQINNAANGEGDLAKVAFPSVVWTAVITPGGTTYLASPFGSNYFETDLYFSSTTSPGQGGCIIEFGGPTAAAFDTTNDGGTFVPASSICTSSASAIWQVANSPAAGLTDEITGASCGSTWTIGCLASACGFLSSDAPTASGSFSDGDTSSSGTYHVVTCFNPFTPECLGEYCSSVSANTFTIEAGIATCAGTSPDTCTGTPASGALSADSTATGVSVAISGTSATGLVTITTSNDGSTAPSTGGIVSISGAKYYDVEVSGASDGSATVCISPANGATTLDYYPPPSGPWTPASSITTPDNEICGVIPVSALVGTSIAIGTSAPIITPEFPIASLGLLALVSVALPVLLLFRSRLARRMPAA